ncbi:hypothetical protein Pla8534_21760 [Lignipirellula cremea]|uniref:Uncharacterized protein n=1 Tax=Lignipirellula cremea TaxID=2528010 RepID=A0A518DRC3_9BACT|nr:hypothetical protein Pla8534_21760 [Lignipirellula cremea]
MSEIDQSVDGSPPYAILPIALLQVKCPVCAELMTDHRVENQTMKCPKCAAMSGHYDGTSIGPVRCAKCKHLSFVHRYAGLNVTCPECHAGICFDVDPSSL